MALCIMVEATAASVGVVSTITQKLFTLSVSIALLRLLMSYLRLCSHVQDTVNTDKLRTLSVLRSVQRSSVQRSSVHKSSVQKAQFMKQASHTHIYIYTIVVPS
jgi:hypothetical protein